MIKEGEVIILPETIKSPAPEVKREYDDGVGKKSLSERFFESISVKKALSLVSAAVATVTMASGSIMAETENTDNPRLNKKIEIKGKMQSQEPMDGEMVGGGGEPIQYKTLEPGSKGQEVKDLKQRMFDLGYFKSESSVNETFTDKTADYVKKFEEINGLLVDGIADSEMQSLFFSDSAIKADGTPVVATVEDVPKSEEIQAGSETTDGAQVVSDEVVNKPEIISTETEEEKEVNQRFAEFLAGDGEYSEEILSEKLFSERYDELDLGFMRPLYGKYVGIQSVLLFHKNVDGEEILALGLKNKKGERKVAIVICPVRAAIENLIGYVAVGETDKISSRLKIEKYYNEEEVGLVLDNKIGMVLKMQMDSAPNNFELPSNPDIQSIYRGLFSDKTVANQSFLYEIWRPKEKDQSLEDKKFFQTLKKQNELIDVSDYKGFMDIVDNNKEDLPFIWGFDYQS